jgi:hypothetical protein
MSTGLTGIKVIPWITAGERKPKVLPTYRDRRVKSAENFVSWLGLCPGSRI